MAITVNTPVENQEIIDRFKQYLTEYANSGIVFHGGSKPFSQFSTDPLTGTSTGKVADIFIEDIGTDDANIVASKIYNALLAETNRFTSIRKLRAKLFVEGGGGNAGTQPTPGVIYDQTEVAFLTDSYLQSIPSVSNSGVSSAQDIDASNLEGLISNLKTAYEAKRNTVVEITTTICHASCHSSCHGNRNRR